MSTEDSITQPSSLLSVHLSVFHGSTNTSPVETLPLSAMLQRIQNGMYQEYVTYLRQLRATQGKDAYDKAKRRSVGFAPAGVFTRRANDKLSTASGLVHFDFDHPPDLAAAKALLSADPYVVYAFISPSGDGLKLALWADGIVDDTTYKHAWGTVLAYFQRTYPDLAVANDKACKDIARLCYASFDPALYSNPEPRKFDVPPYQPPGPKPTPTPKLKPASHSTPPPLPADRRERYAQQAIDTAVQMIQAGIPKTNTSAGTRHDSQLKAARLLGGYVAGGVLSQAEAYAALQAAVASNTANLSVDMDTIADGLRYGEAEPITLDQLEAERLDWLEAHRAKLLVNSPTAPNENSLPATQETAEVLLALLPTLADDAREDAILDAMPALAGLDMLGWMRLKRQLKAAVPRVSLNALERAWNELRRAARAAQGSSGGSTQARLAAALAVDVAGTWAYDLSRQGWMAYSNGLWQSIDTALVNQHIGSFMDDRLQGEYTWNTLNGVEHLLRTRLARTMSMESPGWLPFRNGALHVETLTLYPHNPDRAFIWQLPYHYTPQAPCPKTQAWLHEAVGGADDQVQVLRAYLKAVVTRRVDLERYMEMIGPGGTGKGTYTRLLTALVGRENTFATELKYLEANRFETSNLRGKVLMVVTDAERYSGPVTQLKAITGEDVVRMEEKFKAQRSETAPVMVAIAANEPIQSADYTSGLVRRRLSLAFRHRPATPRDLLSWHAGDWRGELAHEIPGVLNWVLALPDAQMEALLLHTTTKAPSLQATWAQALVETNPLADWANQFLIHAPKLEAEGKPRATKVGIAKKRERSNDYEQQDYWLYPNYRAWIDATGQKPLAQQRFTGLLLDLLQDQLRLSGVWHTVDVEGSRFFGIRLRSSANIEDGLLITKPTA